MKELLHIDDLLEFANSKAMYDQLIVQLNKDFQLANIQCSYDSSLTPEELKEALYQDINQLILEDFNGFLNLVYRIDLSEQQLKKLDSTNTETYINQVTFLILKRIWYKVWLRNTL